MENFKCMGKKNDMFLKGSKAINTTHPSNRDGNLIPYSGVPISAIIFNTCIGYSYTVCSQHKQYQTAPNFVSLSFLFQCIGGHHKVIKGKYKQHIQRKFQCHIR